MAGSVPYRRLRPVANYWEWFIRSLVGAGEKSRWNCEVQRPRSLEVDHQLILRRRLHQQVGRPLTLEDSIDVAGGEAILLNITGTVGNPGAPRNVHDPLESHGSRCSAV